MARGSGQGSEGWIFKGLLHCSYSEAVHLSRTTGSHQGEEGLHSM